MIVEITQMDWIHLHFCRLVIKRKKKERIRGFSLALVVGINNQSVYVFLYSISLLFSCFLSLSSFTIAVRGGVK